MAETIIYSFIIILLPIVPALILYLAIPAQQSEVEGKYQGLNIKLKGAFGSYFILALMLLGFITARVMSEQEFEYWTIEGDINSTGIDDPRQVVFSIQPPARQISLDGHFYIENVPIAKGKNQHSTLNLQFVKNGQTRSQVVHLGKNIHLPFLIHQLEFNENHVRIKTPIVLKLPGSTDPDNQAAGHYDPASAQNVN